MKINCDMNKFHNYAFPMPTVLVTCNDKEGKTNVITIAWHTTISKKPPLYGISVAPCRYSYDLISKTKEFVVNFTPYSLAKTVHFCGTHSGRKTDKIKETNLSLVDSEKVKTPSIKECYAHLECKLFDIIELGDHCLLVGEVVNVRGEKEFLNKELLDNSKTQTCFYLGNNSYSMIDKNKKRF